MYTSGVSIGDGFGGSLERDAAKALGFNYYNANMGGFIYAGSTSAGGHTYNWSYAVSGTTMGGVYNDSKDLIVWFKPETTQFVNGYEYKVGGSYPIQPGGYWPHPVDGITVSNWKNAVYKIKTGADSFGVRINANGSVSLGYSYLSINWINNLAGGGIKGLDYLDELHRGIHNVKNGRPEADFDWDSLFGRVKH